MDVERTKLQGAVLTDDELSNIVGGAQRVEVARCADCGRDCVPTAMYTLNGKKYCPACYRKALRG